MMQGVHVRVCYNKVYFCISLFTLLVFLNFNVTSIRMMHVATWQCCLVYNIMVKLQTFEKFLVGLLRNN